MSKFTKQFTKQYDFDGDTVTIVMNRMKRKAALKLAPMGEFFSADDKELDFGASLEFMDVACKMLMDYVVSLEGLTNEEGIKITKEDVFGEEAETYFMELVSMAMNDLMSESFAGNKAKKSNGIVENISKDLDKPIVSTLEDSQ